MLIALTLALLFFGCSHTSDVAPQYEQTSKLIKENVSDDARKKQALDIVNQMKQTTEAAAKQAEKQNDALSKLLENQQTPSIQIEALANAKSDQDTTTAEKLLDFRFQLKSVLTETEWGKVFPPPTSAPDTQPN